MKTASQLIRIYGVNVYPRPSHYGLSENDEQNCVYFTLKALNCWNPESPHKTHTSGAARALILPKEPQANSKEDFKNGSGGNEWSQTHRSCR